MKNLKTVVKRASSPKPSHAANQLQPLPSQRSKANSQQLFKKYNQNAPADLTRQSALPNKYRIVTEPMDDHLLQLSKSYAKLSRSKRKETKFDSQHNSIKSRQKTISNDRYQPTTQNVCPNCLNCIKDVKSLRSELDRIVALKEKWKNGQIVLEDFIKEASSYKNCDFSHQLFSESLAEIGYHLSDLMKDIEVLTEIDYPKLLSHNIFKAEEALVSSEEEVELKLLLQQLREQSQGRLTIWDLQLQSGHENFKAIIRNLKTNLMHCLRENLQLRTACQLPRREGRRESEEIRGAVLQVLRGCRK